MASSRGSGPVSSCGSGLDSGRGTRFVYLGATGHNEHVMWTDLKQPSRGSAARARTSSPSSTSCPTTPWPSSSASLTSGGRRDPIADRVPRRGSQHPRCERPRAELGAGAARRPRTRLCRRPLSLEMGHNLFSKPHFATPWPRASVPSALARLFRARAGRGPAESGSAMPDLGQKDAFVRVLSERRFYFVDIEEEEFDATWAHTPPGCVARPSNRLRAGSMH
mmetsp:Transcript_4145/g.9833  ORF Transcript_4145/g.9833 Transcript_4145/m.9833 type:complete len:222 (-) Transcript_4145:1086-1751(-)